MIKNIAPRRWALLLGGLACGSFGIALMLRAEVGLGPWDVLHQGLSERSGISIGMVSILVSVPILLLWWPLGERPGIGTVINTILLGFLIDLYLHVLPVQTWLPVQLGQMLVGIVLMGIGTGLYLSAQLGAGPRDGLMMGLVRRSGWSVRLIRTLLEVSVLALGWLLGGSVGLGTLAFAFGIGPVVQATLWLVGGRPAEMPMKREP
ncbi:MAG: YitT family protein [Chloroflexaceae bacterium]|jgi:uncharacterized membrane protein YczE|nr:YitT family protein [Chloroflexaceae bacterium]